MANISTLDSTFAMDVPQNTKSSSPRHLRNNYKAELLRKLHNIIEHTPEVDLEKVKEIREAIAQGKYQINPKSIACSIMDYDPELSK